MLNLLATLVGWILGTLNKIVKRAMQIAQKGKVSMQQKGGQQGGQQRKGPFDELPVGMKFLKLEEGNPTPYLIELENNGKAREVSVYTPEEGGSQGTCRLDKNGNLILSFDGYSQAFTTQINWLTSGYDCVAAWDPNGQPYHTSYHLFKLGLTFRPKA